MRTTVVFVSPSRRARRRRGGSRSPREGCRTGLGPRRSRRTASWRRGGGGRRGQRR
uniref:Uncharacterized protein n=1 Tax=Arundo donax TaxID=35708 RepID=A0A0A9BBS5_ARUDO